MRINSVWSLTAACTCTSMTLSGVAAFTLPLEAATQNRPRSQQWHQVQHNHLTARVVVVTPQLERQQTSFVVPSPSALFLSSSSSSAATDNLSVEARALFDKYCDENGFMTQSTLQSIPFFSQMLEEKELMLEELEDIWKSTAKDNGGDQVDADAFVQIFKDVDDLFEEDGENDDDEEEDTVSATASEDEEQAMDEELEHVFAVLSKETDNTVSKADLQAWEEIQKLLGEGLLGEDEFDELWEQTPKVSSGELIDQAGFMVFNEALDSLFQFDDEEDDEGDEDDEDALEDESIPVEAAQPTRKVVLEDDLPPGVLFAAIADEDYLVGMDDLKYWGELQTMLSDGDILPTELQAIYDRMEKTESGKLNEESFIKLSEEVDALFEDDEEDTAAATPEAPGKNLVKEDLISFIDLIIEEEAMPCGLDCTEKDQKQVLNIVAALEDQPSNIIRQKQGNIELTDLAGTWDLLYSSSSAMKFNQGLSGLGGSFPNGKFGGLKQTFKASKFLTDVEYLERIEVTPSTASFDVSVTGNWDIRSSVSLFTGQPSIIVEIEPDRVNYGPTTTRADHWKSLGPMNMLDLTYLDDDFRVMRGCTSADSIFIFKKEQ